MSLIAAGNKVQWKERFLQEFLKTEGLKESHYIVLTQEEYAELLQEIKDAKSLIHKTMLQYRQIKHFDITEIGVCRKFFERLQLMMCTIWQVMRCMSFKQPILQLVMVARTDLKTKHVENTLM